MNSTATSPTGFNGRPIVLRFDPAGTAPGAISQSWLRLAADGMGAPLCVPLLVARGAADGPVLGLTAAVFVAIGVNELWKALQPLIGG